MTTCLGKSCSFGLPRVPFVNCCQFMYLIISLLVLRAVCGCDCIGSCSLLIFLLCYKIKCCSIICRLNKINSVSFVYYSLLVSCLHGIHFTETIHLFEGVEPYWQ